MKNTPLRKGNGADGELNSLSERLQKLNVHQRPIQASYTNTNGVDREVKTLAERLQQIHFSQGPTQTSSPQQKERSYHYFIRISPVALRASDIQPSSHTRDNFQLRAFLGPGGGITAELRRDTSQMFVVPGQDGDFIIQSLHRYMEKHGSGLFLYVRMPDNGGHLEETREHMNGLSEVLLKYQRSFEVMDVAWFSL